MSCGKGETGRDQFPLGGKTVIVKRFIRQQSRADPYPSYLPVAASEIKPRMKTVGRPIKSAQEANRDNPRGRSAILRVAEKLPQ